MKRKATVFRTISLRILACILSILSGFCFGMAVYFLHLHQNWGCRWRWFDYRTRCLLDFGNLCKNLCWYPYRRTKRPENHGGCRWRWCHLCTRCRYGAAILRQTSSWYFSKLEHFKDVPSRTRCLDTFARNITAHQRTASCQRSFQPHHQRQTL